MKFRNAVVALLMAVFFMPAAAHANRDIAIVDIQYILQETDAAKNIRAQVSELRKKYRDEVGKKEEELRKQEKALLDKRATIPAEDFAKQAKEFETKLAAAQREVMERQEKLENAVNTAVGQLRDSAVEIIAAKAKAREVALVLPRQNVVIVEPSLDLTEEVVAELNKKIKTVKVVVK